MNSMTKRVDNKDNYFHRLPDEIIVTVFNKVADLKCLCRCSLVSKHFAAIIPHVQTVSVAVPDCGSSDKEFVKRMFAFAKELHNSTIDKIPTLLDSYCLQHLKLLMFLHKLRELKSIYLSYEYTGNNTYSHFPMRKMKLARNSAKFERFVALVPRSVHKDNEVESIEAQDRNDLSAKVMECIWQFFWRYAEWLCLLLILVKCHTTLQAVTINDSDGKLVIVGQKLDNIQLHVLQELSEHISFKAIIRCFRLPILHLPVSGYVLREVILVIFDTPGVSQNKWEEIQFWDCDDEVIVLREAVKEILKKHKDDVQIFQT